VESARRQVAAARERNDDQAIFGVCAFCAWIFARAGHKADAGAMLDEILARRRLRPTGVSPGYWTVASALVLERLGRAGEVLALPEPEGSRFLAAARAIDSGSFADGAEVLREIGARPFEAETRLLAARAAHAQGDEEAAELHRARAHELLRELGATTRLGELQT
jgi:hypothetical protein